MDVTDVASVSQGRMVGAGLAHVLVGVTWSIGPILGFLERTGTATSDLRPEVIAIVVLLWPIGIPILLRGVGLLQQAFGASGYFRAGTEGLELRLGGRSLYARLIGLIAKIRMLPANPDTFPLRFPEDGARRQRLRLYFPLEQDRGLRHQHVRGRHRAAFRRAPAAAPILFHRGPRDDRPAPERDHAAAAGHQSAAGRVSRGWSCRRDRPRDFRRAGLSPAHQCPRRRFSRLLKVLRSRGRRSISRPDATTLRR
jgi:hypothetical protein